MDALAVATSLSDPHLSDINPGNPTGATMRSVGNPGILATMDIPESTIVAPNAHNGPAGNPVVAWFAVAVLLILLKFAAEHGTQEAEFSSIRVGFWNFLAITVVAILGLNAAKWFAGTWQIPGVSTLVLAA